MSSVARSVCVAVLISVNSAFAHSPNELNGLLPSWIGVTRKDTPIKSFLGEAAFDYSDKRTRVLIVAGLDKSKATSAAAVEVNRWFQSANKDSGLHKRYTLSVIPNANPDGIDGVSAEYPPKGNAYNSPQETEKAYLWRWIGMHAPDLVVVIYAGEKLSWSAPESKDQKLTQLRKALVAASAKASSLEGALSRLAPSETGSVPAIGVTVSEANLKTVAPKLFTALDKCEFSGPSPARRELQQRLNRSPLEVAKQLSKHYGHDLKQVVYIPTVALIGRLRLAELSNDPNHFKDVTNIVKPYFSGDRPTTPKSGSHLSGHLIFSELADRAKGKDRERYIELARNAADLAFLDSGKLKPSMPFHVEMSDSVFMGGPILAHVGKLTGDKRYFDACAQHIQFMQKLDLREDGIYRHSPLDEAAWGRGNGFPALGLALCLTHFPEDHPRQKELLSSYRSHMAALARHQDPNGCWHQVVDHPWSYRELTSTCMITFAMIRGVRHGWLDRQKYEPIIDRAWYAIRTRVAPNGHLVDVCTGTGKQKNLRAYYDRTAILGKDARGGAMALLVSTEMAALVMEGKK